METSENLAQVEQQLLAQVEEQNQRAVAHLQAAVHPAYPMTLEEIDSLIMYIQDEENSLRRYESIGLELKKAGFPRLSNRLEQVLADAHGALNCYKNMYQQTKNAQQGMANLQRQTATECWQMMQDTIKRMLNS